jgi:hypothetical protein
MMNDDIKISNRKTLVISYDEFTLTFLNPFSGYYDKHLIMIYEDAYGDVSYSLIHRENLIRKYKFLNDELVEQIFNEFKPTKNDERKMD